MPQTGGTKMIKAVAASSGIGIGRAVIIKARQRKAPERKPCDPSTELARARAGTRAFVAQVERVRALAEQAFGSGEAAIIAAQIAIVQDPDFMEAVEEGIVTHAQSAEDAIARVLDDYTAIFAAMPDAFMQAREADFRDVKHRLLGILAGETQPDYSGLGAQSVIVADDLHASDFVCMPVKKIAAILTEGGSPHAHLAILTRALRIPHLVGARDICRVTGEEEGLIVDGGAGEVILCPTAEEIDRYRERQRLQNLERERLEIVREQETRTRDGRRVEMLAALTALGEVSAAIEKGMDGASMPYAQQVAGQTGGVEQQQFLVYKALVRALEGRSAMISVEGVRPRPEGPYPSGGRRGAASEEEGRLWVAFSALLRASAFGRVRVALSGLNGVDELRYAKELFAQCKTMLWDRTMSFDPQIKLGVAVETPAAALRIGDLAREADFVVIETDALAAYTLAMDKVAKKPEDRRSVFHPALLGLICQTTQTAQKLGLPVMVGGEIAADPMMIPFLIGCGAGALCVRAHLLQSTRGQCENTTYAYWQERLPDILALSTSDEVVAYLKQNWAERL